MIRVVSLIKLRITVLLLRYLDNRELIEEERDCYLKCKSIFTVEMTSIMKFGHLLCEKNTPYINHLLYRIRETKGLYPKVVYKVLGSLWKPMDTLFIHTPKIGKGLLVNHGFSTIITAKEIGTNCLISQQVTIGVKEPMGGGTFYR